MNSDEAITQPVTGRHHSYSRNLDMNPIRNVELVHMSNTCVALWSIWRDAAFIVHDECSVLAELTEEGLPCCTWKAETSIPNAYRCRRDLCASEKLRPHRQPFESMQIQDSNSFSVATEPFYDIKWKNTVKHMYKRSKYSYLNDGNAWGLFGSISPSSPSSSEKRCDAFPTFTSHLIVLTPQWQKLADPFFLNANRTWQQYSEKKRDVNYLA